MELIAAYADAVGVFVFKAAETMVFIAQAAMKKESRFGGPGQHMLAFPPFFSAEVGCFGSLRDMAKEGGAHRLWANPVRSFAGGLHFIFSAFGP